MRDELKCGFIPLFYCGFLQIIFTTCSLGCPISCHSNYCTNYINAQIGRTPSNHLVPLTFLSGHSIQLNLHNTSITSSFKLILHSK